MRALLVTLAVGALVLIVLGLLLKALKWLIILGLVALGASVVLGVTKARRPTR